MLHRLGYVYKKLKLVPGKADTKAQEEFIESYKELKKTKGVTDPIYFMDGTHPQHNSVVAYGGIIFAQGKFRCQCGDGSIFDLF